MVKIKRLNAYHRFQAGLDRTSARAMHVVNEPRVLVEPERYNIRGKDGSIDKYTVYNNTVQISRLQKIDGKYKLVSSKTINANQARNL